MGIGEMRLDGQTIAEQVADQNPTTKASPKIKLGHHPFTASRCTSRLHVMLYMKYSIQLLSFREFAHESSSISWGHNWRRDCRDNAQRGTGTEYWAIAHATSSHDWDKESDLTATIE